jgi:transposase-like protein
MMQNFPDADSARIHLETKRWAGNPTCPRCSASNHQYRQKRNGVEGYYLCYNCKMVYTVRTGTIFERSHVPLNKWLFAIYLVVTARKGISSLQLSKEIGVTQKTAWFMLHRIRKASGEDNGGNGSLFGIVEADEVYFGGKENKHESRKQKAGRGTVGKSAAIGMRERGGKVKAQLLSSTDAKAIQDAIKDTVCIYSTVCTDEHPSYTGIQAYRHKTINHSAKQFVDGMAHTNGIESVWAVLKRGFYGIYHSFNAKHLQRYLNEFVFRLNSGNVRTHTLDRIDALLEMCVGRRLTWSTLTK